MAWETEFIANIIPSMKYISFFNTKHLDDRGISRLGKYINNYLIYSNNTIKRTDICDILLRYVDENNSPFSLEYEFSKKFQIEYLKEVIHNVYKLVLLKRYDVILAIKDLRESILHGCTINLDYYYV
jgi:hypothetical protein